MKHLGLTSLIGALAIVAGITMANSATASDTNPIPAAAEPQADVANVVVLEITGEIDLGLAAYLSRALNRAASAATDVVVIRIDTPGGRLDAVLAMRDALLRSDVPTLAFIDQTAFSAGALVALASERIAMTPAAVIGAASPVTGEGVPADEKVVSAVRSTFRSTAEQRGRDPLVAEAMVDRSIAIDGLVAEGQLLTLTTPEAVATGIADAVADDLAALLAAEGLGDANVTTSTPSLAERLVRIITSPLIASLLVMIGAWLIVGDLTSGGAGIGVVVGASAIALFAWGHLLAGLAGWEDLVLIVLGIALILVEILVIPGFGVAGILGVVSLAGGTFLAMLNRNLDFVSSERMISTGVIVASTFLGVVIATFALVGFLARRSGPEGLVLSHRLGVAAPASHRMDAGWLRWFGQGGGILASDRPSEGLGDSATPDTPSPHESEPATRVVGIALTDLRPSGVADIAGKRVDVVTEGDYIARGETIEVVRDDGYRRVVRKR